MNTFHFRKQEKLSKKQEQDSKWKSKHKGIPLFHSGTDWLLHFEHLYNALPPDLIQLVNNSEAEKNKK